MEQFTWKREAAAEEYILKFLEKSCKVNSDIRKLKEELHQYTSTELLHWVDHLVAADEGGLSECGFTSTSSKIFEHPGAQLPAIYLSEKVQGVAISVESIADFLMVRGIGRKIEGSPLSLYRRAEISTENGMTLWVVERRGKRRLEPEETAPEQIALYHEWTEKWQTRDRSMQDEDLAMDQTMTLAKETVAEVGTDLAAWIAMDVERIYWQRKNRAAVLQKSRQDFLGMGWANHDHHTFRSSRKCFHRLVNLFEILGFYCRERFYAGDEAGWGAQVMEHKECGLVLFLDVDLDPEELEVDFAHQELPPLNKRGTIGLWCSLHGDSILEAGMHHLEGQFDFSALKADLAKVGVSMMPPFSDFSYLKQAFTEGEVWPVAEWRIEKLLKEGLITEGEADTFRKKGAIGSHLENLERKEGYKGFNQKNVSWIIKETDPRGVIGKK